MWLFQNSRKPNFLSAITDLWMSAANDSYTTIIIQLIGSDWEMTSFYLETVPLFVDHTGQNIADVISDILDNWNLSRDNLVASTTDKDSNIVSAFRIINALGISCFGHNLNLVIKKGLDNTQVQRAVARCHLLVKLFHHSYKKMRDLRLKQEELGLQQHKIISDEITHWESTYDMIERIAEQQQAISSALAEDRKKWCKMPTDAD